VKFLALSVGGRVDSWNQKQDDFVQFNPRLVGMLFPTDDDVVKLIAGRGFRVGDISERLTRTPTLIALPGPIDPEAAWTAELEYRHRFDNDWSVLASVWQASVSGLIEQRPITDPSDPDFGLLESQNALNGRIRGVDAEVERRLSGGWLLTAWYSHQQPEARLLDAGDDEDAVPLPGAPNDQAAIKLISPLGPRTRVATRVIYEGPRELSGADGKSDGAVLADVVVSGSASNGSTNWYAGVYNVTARDYRLPASTSTFATVEAPEWRVPLLRAGLEFEGKLSPRSEAAATAANDPLAVDPAPPAESTDATPSEASTEDESSGTDD
jgi:outer membrane receptor protein involved in Fe transport